MSIIVGIILNCSMCLLGTSLQQFNRTDLESMSQQGRISKHELYVFLSNKSKLGTDLESIVTIRIE